MNRTEILHTFLSTVTLLIFMFSFSHISKQTYTTFRFSCTAAISIISFVYSISTGFKKPFTFNKFISGIYTSVLDYLILYALFYLLRDTSLAVIASLTSIVLFCIVVCDEGRFSIWMFFGLIAALFAFAVCYHLENFEFYYFAYDREDIESSFCEQRTTFSLIYGLCLTLRVLITKKMLLKDDFKNYQLINSILLLVYLILEISFRRELFRKEIENVKDNTFLYIGGGVSCVIFYFLAIFCTNHVTKVYTRSLNLTMFLIHILYLIPGLCCKTILEKLTFDVYLVLILSHFLVLFMISENMVLKFLRLSNRPLIDAEEIGLFQ